MENRVNMRKKERRSPGTNGWSRKIYMELPCPTEEDFVSDQERILRELREEFGEIHCSLKVLKKCYPLCHRAGWKITVFLVWTGCQWELVDIEAGDTTDCHYGVYADLGSTTIAVALADMNIGKTVCEKSGFNRQIAFGQDILSRIFYGKDQPERMEELRKATIDSFLELFGQIQEETGIPSEKWGSLVLSGNTTMIHFLFGLDAFCVFSSPYAVRTLKPDCYPAKELGFPNLGYVYCFPGQANYLGGDILSGIVATELYKQEELCVFLDIGTNGELVIGNKDFLVVGAGAAGPALEGGVVKTGMRAEAGAVDQVEICGKEVLIHVIGEGEAKGICGSGIVDLLAQMFLNGWIDMKGKLQPEVSGRIVEQEGELAAEYAPGLCFYQSDIEEFLKTKAAAGTMVEYMMNEVGLTMRDIEKFYVAGAFGTHISKESGVTIGLYPDIRRDKIVLPGNTSLLGARKMLLNKEYQKEILELLEKMVYIQFGAVDNFVYLMAAAEAIPHTDLNRYPTVEAELRKRGKE